MVGELLGVDPSLGPLAEDLAGRAGGNPLFVEEMVRDLSEDGTLAGTPGSYLLARPIDSVRMPMSVHAVLAGRIDRLDPAHKQLLQAASVIGREFAIGVLAATLGSGEPELHGGLHELCRAELLQQTGDGEFRFWHPLTQEVAYSGLLSATRRRRHRAAADALIQLSPGRLDELSPLIARHMEQSGDRLEAGRWQSRAAVWAMRGDIAEVLRRVEAAIEHLDAVQQDEQRAEALRLAVWARAFLLRVASRVGLDPTVARDLAERARTDAEQIGDPVLLTSVSMMEGVFHIWSGDAGRARDAMTDAMLRAGESGDESLQAWAFGAGASAYCYAGPVDEGIRRITHGLELCADDASIGLQHAGYNVRDSAKMLSALLYLAGGRLDDARQAMHAANDFLRTRVVLDWLVWNLSMFPVLADITGHPDDLAAAVARVDEMGPLAEDSGSVLSRVHLLRARGLLALQLNRADAALESFADAIAVMRDRGSGRHEEVSVLAELARAHLACGDVTDAVDAAREATRFAASSGANLPGCQAYATLAHVLRRAAPEGAHSQVRTVITTGLALAEQNNATTWLAFLAEERARLDGGDLAAVADGYDAIGATGHAARIRAELAG